ncbi:MAG TPA: FISUMP domain-containing protein [Paludibacter sp.]
MKSKFYSFPLVMTTVLLLFFGTVKTFALDYSISFTGSGASTLVASVEVKNLTQGTSVTVPIGNTLNLKDVETSVTQLSDNNPSLRVSFNPGNESSTVSFVAKQKGMTQINVFAINGKQLITETKNLPEGNNSFQVFLPNGTYVLAIEGNGYSGKAKIISQTSSVITPKIIFSGNETQVINKQKSKSASTITQMQYNTGDQLLYKGISGNYSTIVADVPTGSKTINFGFVACQDADGYNYTIVNIGTQTWMAENLRTTKYNDNSAIPNVTDNVAWSALTTGAYCDHDNSTSNGAIYGHLYNWYAVNTGILAPTGWHVPTDAEWTTLVTFLGGDNVAGGKLKETGTAHWVTPNTGATNETGFGALPAGGRAFDGIFPTSDVGYRGQCWTATQFDVFPAYYRGIPNIGTFATRAFYNKAAGFSVRCVK